MMVYVSKTIMIGRVHSDRILGGAFVCGTGRSCSDGGNGWYPWLERVVLSYDCDLRLDGNVWESNEILKPDI